ncbi:AraC-type DNA-binding protein [Chishuiella changwenlii]|uniref:AraC family transcriptional regulator n=1 Tax=Chishuiella changwenlii TaxID=1434701 RepID=A0A1M7BRE6_9FLAO|nr:helix-turn-helix transcriptional regulator [Chishuiella changwenlii]GGF03382.1 AraC family transcriptional regulator [Chishuiella changwenlii]SHL57551.1 AraC-type DNA-binding protein [Chishuiella changwenlii]
MDKRLFPTFDICNLNADKNTNELFSVDRFRGYVDSNPHLQQVHNHNYYHLVFFTEGSGEHLIDFEKFEAKAGTMYFMKPGQVHQWYFKERYDGYVVNFSTNFLDWVGINSNLLLEFKFLQSIKVDDHVVTLEEHIQKGVANYFELMIKENQLNDHFSNLKIAFSLMNMFIEINRSLEQENQSHLKSQSLIFNHFQSLIEENFKTKKLPKEYAELLHITPNHLNVLSKEISGISAGEWIRSRIILEAKRLLVNKDVSIKEISYLLNFQDVSYFVKFFKKYTNLTPEQFRKQYYVMHS